MLAAFRWWTSSRLHFSPSGDRLALGHSDGTIELWPTRPGLVFDEAKWLPGSSDMLVAIVRNNGAVRSAATTLRVGKARRVVPPIAAGSKSAPITIKIRTPSSGLPTLVRLGHAPGGRATRHQHSPVCLDAR